MEVSPAERYEVGDKIGQLIIIPYPTIYFEEVQELSSTDRNEGGFGSTGI
jgi:dUTP pyrophosphatase